MVSIVARCFHNGKGQLGFLNDLFIYLFLGRGERREKEKERNIIVWLPLTRLLLGT